MRNKFSEVEEALILFGTRCGFGLVFGIGLALIFSLDPVLVAFGGLMVCASFPECIGLGGLGQSIEFEFVDDELAEVDDS